MTTPNRAKKWIRLTVTAPRQAEERVSSLLFDSGALGTVTLDAESDADSEVTLEAYFEPATPIDAIAADIERCLKAEFGLSGRVPSSIDMIEDQDWMEKWKDGFEPTLVGEKLLIAPSWKIPELTLEDNFAENTPPRANESVGAPLNVSGSRLLLKMDPGMAFGTGTHETTRLCLEAIERHWHGQSLLDVGTGTGILAIAAWLLLPQSKIMGIDVDPVAVEVARENAASNLASIYVREGQPKDFAGGMFDVVVANLTAEVIVDLMPDLIECLAPGGKLVLSGILSDLISSVAAPLTESGLELLEQRRSGEWAAVVARYAAGRPLPRGKDAKP